VRQGQCQLRDTVPPTLVRRTHHTLERGRWNPRKGTDACSTLTQDHAMTSDQWDASPPSPSVLRGHPSTAAPSPTLREYVATRHRHDDCCVPYGSPSAAPWISVRTTTKGKISAPPLSKPLLDGYRAHRDAPPEARFARTAVHSVALSAMPSHVVSQCDTPVNCLLLGL
jgi:hypothetical protein